VVVVAVVVVVAAAVAAVWAVVAAAVIVAVVLDRIALIRAKVANRRVLGMTGPPRVRQGFFTSRDSGGRFRRGPSAPSGE
jgi:hypothetical protein